MLPVAKIELVAQFPDRPPVVIEQLAEKLRDREGAG